MLMAALKAEADSFVAQFSDELLADGRQRVVRQGAGPERVIQTGIGPIEVRRQKLRDRATGLPIEAKISFTSNILPNWARRSKSLDALLPALYLRGISNGDFQEALSAILGTDAPNLTPGVVSRLTAGWQEDYDRWAGRQFIPLGHVVNSIVTRQIWSGIGLRRGLSSRISSGGRTLEVSAAKAISLVSKANCNPAVGDGTSRRSGYLFRSQAAFEMG
jgi:hypothetical protein